MNADTKNPWIEKLQAQFEKMKAGLKEKMADAKIESDMQGKLDRFQESLEEAQEAGQEKTEEAKVKLESAWEDLKTSVDRFTS